MAKKNFKVNILSKSSIQKLQDDLRAYKNDLPNKCMVLTERLAEIGINVSKQHIGESPLGKYIYMNVVSEDIDKGSRKLLIATGEIKESENYAPFNILWAVEFGAGAYYNNTANPNADKLGLGVGTFPGQVHAFEDGWYFWDEKTESWRYTHGVKATMPMYNAYKIIYEQMQKIAKEVFR